MRKLSNQRGMTLIELMLSLAISAIILSSLNELVKLGLDAQIVGRGSNELAYQGRFALERMADKARSLAPKVLTRQLPILQAIGLRHRAARVRLA